MHCYGLKVEKYDHRIHNSYDLLTSANITQLEIENLQSNIAVS